MFKTVHRPAPLPPTGQGEAGGARPARKPRIPSRDELGNLTLPPGAVGLSWVHRGPKGETVKAKQPVPVNDAGDVTHREFECGDCPGSAEWVSAKARFKPICPVHRTPLRLVDQRRRPRVGPPWPAVLAGQKERLYVAAAVAAVGAAGAAADLAPMPWWGHAGQIAALPAVVASSWWLTRWELTRRARRAGKLDGGDEVAGRRARRRIGRRARTAAYIAAAAGLWVEAADLAGVSDPVVAAGLLPALAGLGVLCSRPYLAWVDARRRQSPPVPAEPGPADVDELLAAVATWATRVGHVGGVLPGTRLATPRLIKGGWQADIISDNPGSIDPDRWRTSAGRIAGAYRVGVADVAVELNAADASTASVRVQRDNPLREVRMWPGPDATWDVERGVSLMGYFGDDTPAYYRWWNSGGPWHDLISGATGAGKSEFVNGLILSELHSGGLVISRVIDPQQGQSFGDLQDHVDWFAPNIPEARLLLLDTVKEMRRRNRVLSRRRQKDWQATRDMPLIVLTIDEAHEVLKDPICAALAEKLANMARKCGIKLRFITQVPLITQLGNSTPIKDALIAGQTIVFRTGSPLSAQVAFNGTLPVDPHKLPREWPPGSPAAGQTTAGLCYMIGTSARSAPLRTFYIGEDWGRWLRDEAGEVAVEPGVPSEAMRAESGPLWGNRRERIAAALSAPLDDDDILPAGLVQALIASAGHATASPAAGGQAPLPGMPADDSAKDVVLRAAADLAGPDGMVWRRDLGPKALNPKNGRPYSARALTDALKALVDELCLRRVNGDGQYEVLPAGRSRLSAALEEAREQVDEMLGAEVPQ